MVSIRTHLDNRPRKSGMYQVFIRLTKERKLLYIKTPVKVQKTDWNPTYKKIEGGGVKSTHPLAYDYNNALHQMVLKLEKFYLENPKASLQEGKDFIEGKKAAGSDFFNFFEKLIAENPKNWSVGTIKEYKTIASDFKVFLDAEDTFQFEDINTKTLNDFTKYFIAIPNAPATVNKKISAFIGLLKLAVEEGIMPENWQPWSKYKYMAESHKPKTYLTASEIEKIENLEAGDDTLLFHTKNAFLMQFYTAGERVSDMLFMKWANITDSRFIPLSADKLEKIQEIEDARCTFEIFKSRKKKLHSVLMPPQAKKIVDYYYQKRKKQERVFPFLDKYKIDFSNAKESEAAHKAKGSATSLINNTLKQICQILELPPISTHTARRTYADLAKRLHGNMIEIKDAMGHEDSKTTEGYFDKNNFESVDKVQKSVHFREKST